MARALSMGPVQGAARTASTCSCNTSMTSCTVCRRRGGGLARAGSHWLRDASIRRSRCLITAFSFVGLSALGMLRGLVGLLTLRTQIGGARQSFFDVGKTLFQFGGLPELQSHFQDVPGRM